MKLVTHNFLSSKFLKGAKAGYPLKLTVTQINEQNKDYDEGMLASTMKKIDYDALKVAASAIEGLGIPNELPPGGFNRYSDDLKRLLHKIIFCIEIIEGELVCPDTGRTFPIKDGIPNMLVSEEECA